MTDYHGLWFGFLVLFAVLPAVVGAGLGFAWGWRRGARGRQLLRPVLSAAVGLGFGVFVVGVLLFRA